MKASHAVDCISGWWFQKARYVIFPAHTLVASCFRMTQLLHVWSALVINRNNKLIFFEPFIVM